MSIDSDLRIFSRNVFRNAGKKLFTAVTCHPEDEIVAVGDENGRIFIYYNIFKHTSNPTNQLFHWHHNSVETVAFTSSGSVFYSGGSERVLLAWTSNDAKPQTRPRLNGTIRHIVVSTDNQKIAVSTDDNGKWRVRGHFFMKMKSIIEFVSSHSTGRSTAERCAYHAKFRERNGRREYTLAKVTTRSENRSTHGLSCAEWSNRSVTVLFAA